MAILLLPRRSPGSLWWFVLFSWRILLICALGWILVLVNSSRMKSDALSTSRYTTPPLLLMALSSSWLPSGVSLFVLRRVQWLSCCNLVFVVQLRVFMSNFKVIGTFGFRFLAKLWVLRSTNFDVLLVRALTFTFIYGVMVLQTGNVRNSCGNRSSRKNGSLFNLAREKPLNLTLHGLLDGFVLLTTLCRIHLCQNTVPVLFRIQLLLGLSLFQQL